MTPNSVISLVPRSDLQEPAADWDLVRLGDLYTERKEPGAPGLPVMSVTLDHGLVPRESLERRVESDLGPSGHALARAGDLVYNTMRMWQGASGVAQTDCIVSPAYVVAEPNERISPAFARYLFKAPAVIRSLFSYSHGITSDRLRLYFEHFRDVPVRLPPVPEQRRIAAIFSSVDDAIAGTRQVIEQTKRVKQGLLQTLMTRGVGHTRFKKTEIGEIPEAWGISPVQDQFDTQLGKMLNKKARNGPNQRPYVGNAHVQWTRVDFSDIATMHFDEREIERFSLRKGDLLVCEGGEVGRTALWMDEMEECYFQKAIHRLRPRTSYLPTFFLRYMMLAASTGRFSGYSAQTSINHLTQEKLRSMPIPVPPREEQEEISRVFDALDKHIGENEQTTDVMSKLKRGLLQALLTGRVRVQPD